MNTGMSAGSLSNLLPSILDTFAIPRLAELSEAAAAVVFLAGPDASFITGSIIDVNGGFTA